MSNETFVAEIIAENIDPADILHLVAEMAKIHEGGKEASWYSQIGILADRFPAGSRKPAAIMERMQALIPMLKDTRAKGWSFDSIEPGCAITREAMFRGAALAPIYCPRGEAFEFKHDEFFGVVLEQTENISPVS